MADVDTRQRQEEVSKAAEAKRLLDHPLLKAAFEDEERTIIDALVMTHEAEHIIKLHHSLVAVRRLKERIKHHVETGKLAEIQLERSNVQYPRWSRNG